MRLERVGGRRFLLFLDDRLRVRNSIRIVFSLGRAEQTRLVFYRVFRVGPVKRVQDQSGSQLEGVQRVLVFVGVGVEVLNDLVDVFAAAGSG